MKERVAFIHPPGTDVDPSTLKLSSKGITGPELTAARQDRLTVDYSELPQSLRGVVVDAASVEVKWASIEAHDTADPFTARTSPGLHVWYSRQKGGKDIS